VEAGQHAPHLHTLAVTTADAKSWGCAPHPIPAYAGTEADVASAHDAPDGAPPRMKEPLSAIGYRLSAIGYRLSAIFSVALSQSQAYMTASGKTTIMHHTDAIRIP
jgi:hypothetical protein